ncbi:MAG: hypothetical protein V7K67_30195 [Nostoc sp.]|uniref:hypothetical protein n=1 Tax=Nostoc sp. TaxID=1180 RepID=UPI002FF86634
MSNYVEAGLIGKLVYGRTVNCICLVTPTLNAFLSTGRTSPRIDQLGAGHQETKIIAAAEEGKQTARTTVG